jgi:hypothetical protein
MTQETSTIALKEQCADVPPHEIKTRISSKGGQLWIQPEGYGDKCSADGHGCPIGLEIWQGRLRLIVYDDINVEEPQIIDLENARETCRIDKDDSNNN